MMKTVTLFHVMCAAVHLNGAMSFSLSTTATTAMNPTQLGAHSRGDNDIASNTNSRRDFISKAVKTTLVATTVGIADWYTQAAYAEVSAGTSLPDGAAQFSRLIRLQKDLAAVIKRVAENADEIDKKEWDNIQEFLRIVYKGSDDMKFISKASIYDPEKKKKAEEDIKLLQKFAQLGDNPVSKQDAKGVEGILKKCQLVLENYLDLLRDVPADL